MAGPLCFSNQSPLYGRGQQTQPTDIKIPYLAKATIAQQAANRRGTTGGLSKPAKNESAVPLALQTRCGRLWGKSRPRKMLTRSGTCRGTRGSG